jgi:hypothetical protein
MKKLSALFLAFAGIVFPLIAQVDHDYSPNDRMPVVNVTITKEQIPAAVLKAAQTQFDLSNQGTWSKFPYALKEYGWVYDVGAGNLALNRYEVRMKTKEGHDLWAVYSAEGDLIESREASTNVTVPAHVKEALAKSEYKDWNIIGDKEIIKYYHDHTNTTVEQHFRLTVQKDKVKRSISFNFQGGSAN